MNILTEKYSFRNDYSELAHPSVLKKLASVEYTQFDGYGLDKFSEEAKRLIKEKINKPDAHVHLVSGGTQANLIVLSSILRPYEAVISCETGHIFTHETGAIEATGHKICTVVGRDGKLNVSDIDGVVKSHRDEHMVKARVVFISLSTEVGSIYNKAELTKISSYCREHNLYLYLDGARLGTGINSSACDLTYSDIANLVDAFYIGGTKNGMLCGEAIVICNEDLQENFRYHIKQKGGLLAKGASLGLQFIAMFQEKNKAGEDLYDQLAGQANDMAIRLAEGLETLGYEFLSEPETNQIFPIFPVHILEKLHSLYGFYDWAEAGEGKMVVRLVTSWATPPKVIDEFLEDLIE
jgi:threonine aldolase